MDPIKFEPDDGRRWPWEVMFDMTGAGLQRFAMAIIDRGATVRGEARFCGEPTRNPRRVVVVVDLLQSDVAPFEATCKPLQMHPPPLRDDGHPGRRR